MFSNTLTAPTQSTESTLPFLGSEVAVNYDSASVVILPIPYELTTTYRKGCCNGPQAILEASQHVEYFDEELNQESCTTGIYTHQPIAICNQDTYLASEEMLTICQQTIERLNRDNKFVIALGGEHSITAGLVAGYQSKYGNEAFTVVQIDAHGDLRHEYEDSIHNHACVMRRIIDMGLPTVQLGIRSMCKEEADLIQEKSLTVFSARQIAKQSDWIDRAIASIPTRNVFLTIDLDGIDPALIPGVGTPEPGGLDWYSLIDFIRRLFKTHTVIGCDVMELSPIVDSVVSEFVAAKLVYKLVGYHTTSLSQQ